MQPKRYVLGLLSIGLLTMLGLIACTGAATPQAEASVSDADASIADVRRYFRVTSSDATDGELERLLASPHGVQLRFFVELARVGEHAFDPSGAPEEAGRLVVEYMEEMLSLEEVLRAAAEQLVDMGLDRFLDGRIYSWLPYLRFAGSLLSTAIAVHDGITT